MTQRERHEYQAAKSHLGSQPDSRHFRLIGDDDALTFQIKIMGERMRTPSVGTWSGADAVPGLIFDAFHLGQALATRDALNRAVERGMELAKRASE